MVTLPWYRYHIKRNHIRQQIAEILRLSVWRFVVLEKIT